MPTNYLKFLIPVLLLSVLGFQLSKSKVSPRFNHVVVLVSDMERSMKFYTTAFDLKLANAVDFVTYTLPGGKEVEREIDIHFLKFDKQDFVLELVAVDSVASAGDHHIHHLGVDVEDIVLASERVMAAGAELLRPIEEVRIQGLVTKHCFFKGPDGEVLELMQIMEGDF